MAVVVHKMQFDESQVCFFDCDDCLYFNDWDTAKLLTDKIEHYCVKYLNLAPGDAYKMYKKHGTCLRGLINEGIVEGEASIRRYLEAVHDIPLHGINKDSALREMLLRIKLPKWVFTASVEAHASRCLKALGIEDLFEGIIDCTACNYNSKHSSESFQIAMQIAQVKDPFKCIFFDDSVTNIRTAKEVGWTAVLVGDVGRDDGLPVTCTEADYTISKIHDIETVLPGLFSTPTPFPVTSSCSDFILRGKPTMEHMLPLTMISEFSGLKWSFDADESKDPIITIGSLHIHKDLPVINMIARLSSGTESVGEYAVSQMLLGEGEVLKEEMTLAFSHENIKTDGVTMKDFFTAFLSNQLHRLEALISTNQWTPFCQNMGSKPSVGELYYWSQLHQVVLVKTPEAMTKDGSTPLVRAWYIATLTDFTTQRVLTGDSAVGALTCSYLMKD